MLLRVFLQPSGQYPAAESVLKIMYLPLRGEYSVYRAGVRAGRADYSAALCQPMICPVLYHLCHSAVQRAKGTDRPFPYFFVPFRAENLYLLWECNLFLMDNVTLERSWIMG